MKTPIEPDKKVWEEFLRRVVHLAEVEMKIDAIVFIIYLMNLIGHTFLASKLHPDLLKIALDELLKEYEIEYKEKVEGNNGN